MAAVNTGSVERIRLATLEGRYPRLTLYRPKPATVGPAANRSSTPHPAQASPNQNISAGLTAVPGSTPLKSRLKINRKQAAKAKVYMMVVQAFRPRLAAVRPIKLYAAYASPDMIPVKIANRLLCHTAG